LVRGAAGSVGACATQMAKAAGASVYGTARTRDIERVRALGAEPIVEGDRVGAQLVSRPLDAVIDTLGQRSLFWRSASTATCCRSGLSDLTAYASASRPFRRCPCRAATTLMLTPQRSWPGSMRFWRRGSVTARSNGSGCTNAGPTSRAAAEA